jgi:hypothetical protein
MQIGIRHSPSTNHYGFAKIVAFYLCPFCTVMPTSGERGGGEFQWGGEGVNGKHEMMMMGDDGDEQLVTFFTHWHSEGSRMT